MCHDLFKVTIVLKIQFRFLPIIPFWVDHLCVMLRVVIQKILLFFSLLLCYFNRSAKIKFIHGAPQTFLCEMWFYQWFEPFSLMQVLLEYLICFKPLWRLLFYSLFIHAVLCFGILLERRVNIWRLNLFLSKDLLSYHWGINNNNKPVRVNEIRRCVVASSSILH